MQIAFQPCIYGRYILLNKIAVGGMAEVFRAKSFRAEGFEKLIAIKRLYTHLSESQSFVQMFINEAKLAATLNHVNVAPIFDFGLQDSLYFIAMEYVRGCDLSDLIIRCRQVAQAIPLGLAIWLLIEICNGLDYAHRKHDDIGNFLNLIHRDITPQNILISYEGEVKITDFGIAKAQILGRDDTTNGVLKGKFSYMSPEQVRGDRMDHRSDLFSLGIVAWELLTCQKLFDGPNDYVILEKVREAICPPLRTINPQFPVELEQILMRALTRSPQDRYPSVAEMRLDLLRFLSRSHLFPSRAHLSAFLRKLFKERLEEETQAIAQETLAARKIHEDTVQSRPDPNESTFYPKRFSSPNASNPPPVEILVAPPASPFAQPPPLSEAASPFRNPSSPFALQISMRMEHDEPTLPDVREQQASAPPLPIAFAPPPSTPLFAPRPGTFPPPAASSLKPLIAPPPPGPSGLSVLAKTTEEPHVPPIVLSSPPLPSPRTPENPPLPVTPSLSLPASDDGDDPSAFPQRSYAWLFALGSFVLGLVAVFFLAQWLSPPSNDRLVTYSSAPSLPPPQTSPSSGSPPSPSSPHPAQSKARLIISTKPWAHLYINRTYTANTQVPFNRLLPTGVYSIELHFPRPSSKNRSPILPFTVRLQPGQEYKFEDLSPP